jgi:hypothetical protein
MPWTHYADELSTADMTGKSRFLRFSPSENVVIVAMRTWIVLINPPSFTNLHCKLYGDRAGLPGGLIATSTNSFARNDLLETHNYGAKEIYFEFSPKISLNQSLNYHFVLNADNYTFTENSHLAWRKAWPDPIYGEATFGNLLRSTYMFSLIGAPL